MKKLFSLISIIGLVFFPHLAFAQSENASEPVLEAASDASVPSTEVSGPLQESTASQESISSDLLEDSVNPQEQKTSSFPEASSSPSQIENDNSTSTEEVIQTIEATTSDAVANLPLEILKPQKEYSFEINGSLVAANENLEWTEPLENRKGIKTAEGDKITEAPAVDLSEPHVLTVSGACNDPYFVILIYKDSLDYNTSPSSYIYNRAYPCENGQYSYDVKDLPFSLESGTFYLMVAGQGNKGPWKPISALVPIGITVKTTIPESSTTPHESSL